MKNYPFSAIVGQDQLKRALLLCAINPSIGGVLIKGEKGTAKSTAVRGLSSVMPPISRVHNSLFNTSVVDTEKEQPGQSFETEEVVVPFVDLPLGASEDRVLGSLDLEAIVSQKKRTLQPGLLASAHRGILYIDEVNLLADHLVDVLLDVSASGVNTVQREGLSYSHPSRFVLIGTMNPEEGNLRPQFLDRFGLMVEVAAPNDAAQRTEVVRRRMAYESDPEAFVEKWAPEQKVLQNSILAAQKTLPQVQMPDGLLNLISQLCIDWSVASLRADIVMYKTAVTLAAWAGRKVVNGDDIREAATLVLQHRRSKGPSAGNNQPPPTFPEQFGQELEKQQEASGELPQGEVPATDEGECGEGNCPPEQPEVVFAAAPNLPSEVMLPESLKEINGWMDGRRSKSVEVKGRTIRVATNPMATEIAVSATVAHALARDPDHFNIKREDLHQKMQEGRAGHLILFVVDASGSMAAGKRMEAVKGSVMSLLQDAYQKRDQVGVIAFRGVEAELLLPPTLSIDLAEKSLELLPTGGRTPLAHALQLASDVFEKERNRNRAKPILIVLSDGKANVPLQGGGDAWQQALQAATKIGEMNIQSLVLDTEKGYLRFGRAGELASAMQADCISLDDLSSDRLTETVLKVAGDE